MVGTGMGAKNGILIKGGRALEASRSIRRIVLDKTGTVTEGKLTVVAATWAPSHDYNDLYAHADGGTSSLDDVPLTAKCADGVSRAEVIAMVASTEARSEHPLAKAVAVYGKDMLAKSLLPIRRFKGKHTIYVGNSRFVLQSNDTQLPSALSSFDSEEETMGRTAIFVSVSPAGAVKPVPVLAIALSDAPRPSSVHAIRALQAMGIEVNMMTGDGRALRLLLPSP
ncbi:Copper-exporting P-type ATPase A [Grifola frondosa]|uniref:Copper-exporting P-type ATPase A n=1 Tax=Grifola frondosa TaxID=5627 RepID=A0A1C7LPY8_GRIFR|nr:Copper-exporting P-type ATPase A [Grifola frondosa]